jgi:hypothetical protein
MERAWIACWFGSMVALIVVLGFPFVSHSESDDSLPQLGEDAATSYHSGDYSSDDFGGDRTPGFSIPTQYPTGENSALYDDVAQQFEEFSLSPPSENLAPDFE